MRSPLYSCAALLIAALGCAHPAPEHPLPVSTGVEQLLVVRSATWDTPRAQLQRYERAPSHAWRPVGGPIEVVIGYAGYAWGRGLHGKGAPAGAAGPVKREGDGRSPAGVFALGTSYGYADQPPSAALPYQRSGPDLRCVDDPDSSFYNRVISAQVDGHDWNSAEIMRREDELYELAISVRHNLPATARGAGSCIFLHVWESPDTPVRGCTAMAKPDLLQLARWLRPEVAVMVALPEGVYLEFRDRWKLP